MIHIHLISSQEAYKMVDHRLLERALHRTCNLHSGDWNMNVVRKCLYYLSHSAITWVPNSAISNSPNLKFAYLNLTQSQLPQSQIFLANSKTYPFQPCLQSQTQPILDTPDFKLFISQTHLVSWFVQHTNVLQHSLFVLCLRLSVLLCTNTIKNSLNPAHYCLRCFFVRKFTMLVHVSIRYTVVML